MIPSSGEIYSTCITTKRFEPNLMRDWPFHKERKSVHLTLFGTLNRVRFLIWICNDVRSMQSISYNFKCMAASSGGAKLHWIDFEVFIFLWPSFPFPFLLSICQLIPFGSFLPSAQPFCCLCSPDFYQLYLFFSIFLGRSLSDSLLLSLSFTIRFTPFHSCLIIHLKIGKSFIYLNQNKSWLQFP